MFRTENPVQKLVPEFNFTKAKSEITPTGIKLHTLHAEDAEISRLQIEFNAGYAHQKKSLVANLCAKMLNKGTTDYTAKEINEQFDRAGAFWEAECMADKLLLTLHCLPKNLSSVLPLVANIIKSSTFPQLEFEQLLSISKQKFLVNCQKVSFVARQVFIERLYNNAHPYNNTLKIEDFECIDSQDLLEFYKHHIKTSPFELYASANLGQTAREAINAFVHEFDFMENQTKESTLKIHPPDNHHREMEIKEISDFQQNAIRIGLPVIGKEHADYAALYYTNVLFGGFFGSRLMRNIREDKGYTYGIHSGIANNDHSSYFFINTEVGNEYVNDTLKEIKAELNLLKESEIHQDEIRLVRNYTLGSIMRGFDGAFNAMDRYRSLKKLNHDYSYYDNLIAEIRTIDSDKIRSVAKKYLNWEQMIKIVVGSKA